MIFWTAGQLHIQEYKATSKQIVRVQLNGKKSKKSVICVLSLMLTDFTLDMYMITEQY